MRQIIVAGTIGVDAEVKISKSGNSYLTFRFANREYGEENATWYTVMSHSPFYVNMAQHLKKGKHIIVVGNYEDEAYVNKSGKVEINRTILANSIEFNASSQKSSTKQDTNAQVAVSNSPTTDKVAVSNSPTRDKRVIPTMDMNPVSQNQFTGTPYVQVTTVATESDDLPF